MKQLSRKIVTLISFSLLAAVPFSGVLGYAPVPVYADSSASVNAACDGIGDCNAASSANDINNVIKVVVNIISSAVGIVAVLMIVMSGFKYITANGDAGKLASARSTIIYAIVGLIIVALAQVIVHFVIKTTTKS